MNDTALSIKWDLLEFAYGQGLDLGCGDARPHDWMVGVDVNPGSGPRGPNIIADARDLKIFADESQDYVFSSYLLNELGDFEKVLKEWWRILKPNGHLILFLPVTPHCAPKMIVDAMVPLKPWRFMKATINNDQFMHVYKKADEPTTLLDPKPEKVVAVCKLGAHGDALWASSIFPHLKEQGYHTILYTQETGEQVLRHDPYIDQIIRFESRVPIGELGELFRWMEAKYKDVRIMVECVEGTLLPSPQKIQYHFPQPLRNLLMDHNYLEIHHLQARVPYVPRVKFYPSDEEKRWANGVREKLLPKLVVIVPNGSSCSKYWPYASEFVDKLLRRYGDLPNDTSVVMLGDERGCTFNEHPNFFKLGTQLDVRRAMTLCQLADVVIGQETGLLNSVSFEEEVHKVVLLSHSTEKNLTRDWPNTTTIRKMPACAPCHRLHYDWQGCSKHPDKEAAICQEMITADEVVKIVSQVLDKQKAFSCEESMKAIASLQA